MRVRGAVKIPRSGFSFEEYIADKKRHGQQAPAEIGKVFWGKEDAGGQDAKDYDRKKRRKDAAYSAFIERDERKPSQGYVGCDYRCNQIAGNHKEDIDAHKTAREPRDVCVEEEYRQNGKRPQAVYFGPVFVGAGELGLESDVRKAGALESDRSLNHKGARPLRDRSYHFLNLIHESAWTGIWRLIGLRLTAVTRTLSGSHPAWRRTLVRSPQAED